LATVTCLQGFYCVADSGDVEPAGTEQLLVIAVLDEAVGQTEVGDRQVDTVSGQAFAHRTAGATGDDVFLHGDEGVMGLCQLDHCGTAFPPGLFGGGPGPKPRG